MSDICLNPESVRLNPDSNARPTAEFEKNSAARSHRVVGLCFGEDARNEIVTELLESVDFRVWPTLGTGDAADGQGARAPGECQWRESSILAGTVGEGARQIEAGLDQHADIDEIAQLRPTQESAELVDEELMRRFDEDRGISHREGLGSLCE